MDFSGNPVVNQCYFSLSKNINEREVRMQYLFKFPKDVDHMGFGGAKFQNACLGVYSAVEIQQRVS